MSYGVCYDRDLLSEVKRYSKEDLVEMSKADLEGLLSAFNEINKKYQDFKKECFLKLDKPMYSYYMGIFNIALLKLSVAIENIVGGSFTSDEVKKIVSMYTEDEKNLVRELERFNVLEEEPDVLKEYIVSKHSGIYELIKEAVNKQYVDFEKLVESWSNKPKVREYVRNGLITVYKRRFLNVVEAIKMLLSEEPSWIRRLFREYEDALLSSSELRRVFEEKMRTVYEEKARYLNERIEGLESEKKDLMEKIDELSRRAYSAEVEKRVAMEHLAKLQQELNKLRSSYDQILRSWEGNLRELEYYKEELRKKEREIEEIRRREGEHAAAREALELEVSRLRQLVASYESKLREYEAEKRKLDLELRSAEERLNEMEKVIRGEVEGRAVPIEEVKILHRIFIDKLQDKLRTQPVVLRTPWGTETIDRWSDVKIYYEGDPDLPRTIRAVFTYEKRSLLGLGERRRVTVIGISLLSDREAKKRGFALARASLTDLNEVLREVSDSTGEGRALTLIAISSPTGWDAGALKYVTGEGGLSLITTERVVLLVDPVENKVYYPERLASTARYIEEYARLFTLEISAEEENRVVEAIRSLCDEAAARSPFEPVFPYELVEKRVKLISQLSLIRARERLKKEGLIRLFSVDSGEWFVKCGDEV